MPRQSKFRTLGLIGAHEMHATHDSRKTSKPGRDAFDKSFEDKVDLNRELDPEERARRVQHARKAYFYRLSLRSAEVRRSRKASPDSASRA